MLVRSESAFAEASRVALTSLVFSLASLIVLWLLQRYEGIYLHRFTRLTLPNIGLWLTNGNKYVAGNLGKVFSGLAAEVILACGLAAGAAWLFTLRSRSRFRKDTVYGLTFTQYAPQGSFPWVYVKLDDGTEFRGYHKAHNDRSEAAARVIVLAGKALRRKSSEESEWQQIGNNWDIVVIDSARIQYMQVIYRDKSGALHGARTDDEKHGRTAGSEPRQDRSGPEHKAELQTGHDPAGSSGTQTTQ
jgi:Family of unknown function (DUF6338)